MSELAEMLSRMEIKNHKNNGLVKQDAISLLAACYLVSDLLFQVQEYLSNECPDELRAKISRWATECQDGGF